MKKLAVLLPFLLVACSSTGGSLNVPDAQTLFKNACAGISVANGAFVAVSPALLASGKLTQADLDTEKTTFVLAEATCTNPPIDPATGQINYETLAIQIAADAATIYTSIAQ